MPFHLFDTAFRNQRLGLMLTIIMTIMVFLGSLAMAAQAALVRTSVSWEYDLQSRLTVEVPSMPDELGEIKKTKTEKIVELLKDKNEIDDVTIVPESETTELLKSWISDPALFAALPLPTLIDVDLKVGRTIDRDKLREELSRTCEGIMIHSHASWMDRLMGFLTGLGILAGIMLALTAIALVASIIVICRAAMSVQHDTIELLHFMGATDVSIAKEFQRHIRYLAIPAAVIGFLLALITLGGLTLLLNSLGGLSLLAASSWVTVGIVMALIPIGAIFLAILTARLSVQKFLQRLR
ncbi:MAG: cell division protein FtsX [Bdellovibrionales bacterium]